ncbi:MAG: hypothetical protein GWP56_12300 [Gammaproteobacteria bacterium]|nr:hypothetical protein [Gammaproteobacteria bacterium]
MICLQQCNPLLREPLQKEHGKHRLLGHFGTVLAILLWSSELCCASARRHRATQSSVRARPGRILQDPRHLRRFRGQARRPHPCDSPPPGYCRRWGSFRTDRWR